MGLDMWEQVKAGHHRLVKGEQGKAGGPGWTCGSRVRQAGIGLSKGRMGMLAAMG